MKKITILFLIIFTLILIISIGCSEGPNTEEQKITHNREKTKILRENIKRSKKSIIDLLCLKYEVNSETLKKDLSEYLEYLDPDFLSPDLRKDKIKMKEIFSQTDSGKIIDIEELNLMSKKSNVPIKTVAGIVYDYMIWIEVKHDYQHEK